MRPPRRPPCPVVRAAFVALLAAGLCGCRSARIAGVVPAGLFGHDRPVRADVESVANDSVARLLARHVETAVRQVAYVDGAEPLPPAPKRVCFIGVESDTAAEAGDAPAWIDEAIRRRILASRVFQPVEREPVEAALRDTGLRHDQVLAAEHLRTFASAMERQGRPIDYVLRATIVSGVSAGGERVLELQLADVGGGSDREAAALGRRK